MRNNLQQNISNLKLSVADPALEKLLGDDKVDFDPAKFNFEGFAATFAKHLDLPGCDELTGNSDKFHDKFYVEPEQGEEEDLDAEPQFSEERFVEYLRENLTTADQVKDFALRFAEKVFLADKVKVKGINPETADFIRDFGDELEQLRSLSLKGPKAGLEALDGLRHLDERLVDYVASGAEKKSDAPGNGGHRTGGTNYWALNEQHRELASLIAKLEKDVIAAAPESLRNRLQENGLLRASEVLDLNKKEKAAVSSLTEHGILSVCEIPGVGQVYAYAGGQVTRRGFEQIIPKLLREQLGYDFREEFLLKYSGQVRPISIGRPDGSEVQPLLDRYRIEKLADSLELSPAHVTLALKYLASTKLVTEADGEYSLTPAGKAVGLGFRAVRLVERIENGKPGALNSAFRAYLDEAIKTQQSWAVPTYEYTTADGGLPRTFLMDRWHIPNARFSEPVFKYTQQEAAPGSLVVMGNMLQGAPGQDKRQMRTTVKGFEELDTQYTLVNELGQGLKADSVNILGRTMDRTAELRAFDQVIREQGIFGLETNADERAVRAVRQSKNDISRYNKEREFAPAFTEWSEFISRVVQPFEIKLGRVAWESYDIRERTDIDMNELEILRDISGLMVQAGSVEAARPEIDIQYADFIRAAEESDPKYLEKLGHVVFAKTESISSDELISRGGLQIQMKREEDGADGLKVNVISNMNYGKSIRTNPTTSMVGLMKSYANRGDKGLADVNIVLDTGEPWISITGTGKWVMSTGTMEYVSAEPRDHFHDAAMDHVKKKAMVHGRPPETGVLVVSGGVNEGVVTHAMTFEFITPKLLQVLEDNKARGLPEKEVKIYSTSDWQIGSPTMKEKMAIVSLLAAIKDGAEEVLMNGDIQQGMNYLRYCVESGLVKNPLVGVEDQTQYIIEMMNPVLEYIGKRYRQDPAHFNLPKFRILVGNHEANTQANKGLQGNWLLSFLDEKITSYYHALLDDRAKAEDLVKYPRKYVAHDGTPVDYSLALVDYSADTGFRIEVTHYDGAGAKGSNFTPPIAGAAAAVRSLELQEPHILMRAHFHTPAWTTMNGVVCGIFGANAGPSGFERHLGYNDGLPSNGMIELSSTKVPRFTQITDKYTELREKEILDELHSLGILTEFKSFEEFCENRREKVSQRVRGVTDFTKLPKGLPHDATDATRKIGRRAA